MKTAAAIIVGYSLKMRPDADEVMPEFHAPGNYGPDKAAEYVQNKKEQWRAGGAARSPYSGTIDHATIVALPTRSELKLSGNRGVDVFKSDSVVSIAAYLCDRYACLYDDNGESFDGPLRIIGFDPRTFVKIMALEASENDVLLPHELWYAADYRDIESAACPEKTDTTLAQALRRLLPNMSCDHRPGINSINDALVATALTMKLNLLPAWKTELDAAIPLLSGKQSLPRSPVTESPLSKQPLPAGAKPKKKVVKTHG